MNPVWILVGCVAVIGVALVLYKRITAKSVKVEETAASAKQ